MSQLRGLYAITDSQLLSDGRLIPYCTAALKGGARILQYRDKSANTKQRLYEAQALYELCQQHEAQFIVNDDLELACKIGCGLHLGQEDGSLEEARQQLPSDALLGATCHHHLELAQQAVNAGVSYIAFGRFFPSHTKLGAALADSVLLKKAQAFNLPIVAIGGIELSNASPLIQHGADMIAVIHALFAAPTADDVEHRARAFSSLFN